MNLGKSLKPQLLQNLMLSIHSKKMYEKDNVNDHKNMLDRVKMYQLSFYTKIPSIATC